MTETYVKLLLQSELEGPLRWSSEQSLLKRTVRAKAFVTSEVLQLSELRTITVLEAWAMGNSRRYLYRMFGDRRWLARQSDSK